MFSDERLAMHLFFSSAGFIFTVFVGVAAFVLAAIHTPTGLKQLIDMANVGLSNLLTAYVPDQYSVLIGFVFDGKNVVLMGFIIAARIILSMLITIFAPASPGRDPRFLMEEPEGKGPSPFDRWGRGKS
jgi:hypothetical protein